MTKENRALVAVTVVPKTAGPNEEGLRMRLRTGKALQRLCAVVGLAVALCVLAAAPALATYTHVFSTAFGEPGSGDGQMELQAGGGFTRGGSGVAVNASTHDVYVADTGNHRVDEFSASGAFLRAWGWGVADGTTEALQTCTSGCHAGLPGVGARQLNEPTFIAVDNSGGPSEGDVYVADSNGSGSTFVLKFSASGGYLSSNDGSGAIMPVTGPFGNAIGGIAVDASGNLWVFAVDKGGLGDQFTSLGIIFEFAQDGGFIMDWSDGHLNGDVGIAVDHTQDVYVENPGVGFNNVILKYTPSGGQIGEVQHGDSRGLAVNLATSDLYVDNEGERIAQYDSSCDPASGLCTPLDTFGSGELKGAGNLAVDPSDDTVYASDVGDDRIAAFGRTPDVTTGRPVNRAATVAVVSGTVDPDNSAVSDCHFDYVSDAAYSPAESDPYAAGGTVPCDTTPSGAGAVTVHAELAGLTPGVVYHFRLQVTNVYGTSFGADETVPGTPPAIDATSAADITSASAELLATINPDGGDTTYRFEYGPTTSYGASAPVPDGDAGSGASEVTVARRIQGLLASTVYHYRVVAHNLLGTTTGSDRTFTTQPNGGGVVDTCINAAIRTLQHAATLLDCRAYEQVSPADKDGSPILGTHDAEAEWQASPDGGAIAYTSSGVFADAQTGAAVVSAYLSSRTPSGWSTHSLLPLQDPGRVLPFVPIGIYSKDLSKAVLPDGGTHGQDQPPLVQGEPSPNQNLFLRDNATNTYQLIDLTPASGTPEYAELEQGSADLNHVVFSERAQLTPDAPPPGPRRQLYEWSEGVVRLVGILPNGTSVPASESAHVPHAGGFAGGTSATALKNHAVSDDGSRVFFEVEEGPASGLYLRQDATSTVQLDAPHGSGPGGDGRFAVASSDGSDAFFLDDAAGGLSSDTAPGSGSNLYRYDANSHTLSDLTPTADADVQGVIGASNDGSYVYFVADGVLAPGALAGNCISQGNSATESCNLYLYHNGTVTFIAALNGEDQHDWPGGASSDVNYTATVSPGGRYLAFQSLNSLTGYDNSPSAGVQCGIERSQSRCTEVYLYDAATGKLGCASCNPSGEAPAGSSLLAIAPSEGTYNRLYNYMPRYLSDSGRLFFNSLDALAPQDVNGQWDVYEYEPGGVGSCQQAQGCISLISTGASPDPSFFRDASATGEDVFFTTSDSLVAQDGDRSFDMYDARVDGGLASQNEVPLSGCGGEACRPPAPGQPFSEQAPGSSVFSGPGNPQPASSPPARKKPPKKHQRKKRHIKKKGHKPVRRATHKRGGAK